LTSDKSNPKAGLQAGSNPADISSASESLQNKASTPARSFSERLWDFFASVRLSLFLFLILAAASVAGTIVTQHQPAQVYTQAFGQRWSHFILALGLDDLYHTPWFRLLLTALGVNLVVCSLKRLPIALKIMRKDPAEDLRRRPRAQQTFTIPGAPTANAPQARRLLEKALGAVHQDTQDHEQVLFATRGAWSRLGVYVVHASVLIIFAGGLVGNFWGFSGRVNIYQGQSIDAIRLNNGQPHRLGFSVRLDKCQTDYHPGGMPREYRADIAFLQGDKEIKKTVIRVNHPAEHQSVDFYLSTLGESPQKLRVRLLRGEQSQEIELKHHKWSPLPGGGRAGVMDFHESVTMGGMYKGPVARIAFQASDQDQPVIITAFKAGAKMPQRAPVKFEIIKAELVAYSGLKVKYDPGVWFIWVGCTLMVIGFFITFYMAHRKVWIRLSPSGQERTRVEIAGSTNKNRTALSRLLGRLASDLKPNPQPGE
jgi:cytochrome c biogenesis protein